MSLYECLMVCYVVYCIWCMLCDVIYRRKKAPVKGHSVGCGFINSLKQTEQHRKNLTLKRLKLLKQYFS